MKKSLLIFHILTIFQSIANNLAHPVTPALINNLALRDSMFGFAFAAMSTGIFLFSLFWGELSSRIKKTTILLIALVGYGVAQYLFMIATNEIMIVAARFMAGVFTGGFQVSQLNYLVSQNSLEARGYHLTLSSILVIASSTVGYFIGGIVGDTSIPLVFYIQVLSCFVVGILYYVLLTKSETVEKKASLDIKKMNPLSSIGLAKDVLTPMIGVVMVVVLFAWMASTSFDQSFNYYIRDVFNFPPSYNGYLKMATGLVGVVANFSLGMYLIKRTNVKKSYSVLMAIMGVSGLIAVWVQQLWLFIFFAFIFIALDAMSKPLQQSLVASLSDDYHESHILMGFYNTMRSLGMIVGALLAGLIYEQIKIGPFVFASVVILVGGFLLMRMAHLKDSFNAR